MLRLVARSVQAFAHQERWHMSAYLEFLGRTASPGSATSLRLSMFGRWAAFALAGVSAGAVIAGSVAVIPASCSSGPQNITKCEDMTEQIQEFKHWLSGLGAHTDAVNIRQSPQGHGLALYPSALGVQHHNAAWLRPLQRLVGMGGETTLASFPLQTVLSAKLVTQQPGLGLKYKKLLASGEVDERMVVMLFLLVEKLRGEDSMWSPWLNLLPASFDTPLHFTESQLQELQGTTLHAATRVLNGNLERMWTKLEPVCQDLLLDAGHRQRAPSFQDFLWAYSIFWSRAQSLPVPAGANGEVTTQESIVPGLDFANHANEHSCRWTLWGNRKASGMHDSISLVTTDTPHLSTDNELQITYGDKSNEELLFLYGFALPDNKDDVLMVTCPLPPAEQWDDVIRARMLFLLGKGLSPQLFLPASRLPDGTGHQGSRDHIDAWLPNSVQDVLKAMLMDPAELAGKMQSSASTDMSGKRADELSSSTGQEIEDSGMKLAMLTCVTRLLEAKCEELEEEGATGRLERDQQLLEAAHQSEGEGLPARLHNTILYRMGQKRLAREYLQLARSATGDEMHRMRALVAKEEAAGPSG
ncbi:hypothetical protein CVIRNUC_002290 [Coccomyxa viridis]|uniref:SET domain-containing protein n=1 Tax=Coccomyxa viridis TaxID=1274662 RepID=A0AAV1HVR2_9CHLO|nr:hypothetical protein CVIRNUC_002290 [Coccomyxa viridis]